MAHSSLADELEDYVRFDGGMPMITCSDTNKVIERGICLLEERLNIDRTMDYNAVPSQCKMAYTKTIRSVKNILRVLRASDDSDYRIKLMQLKIEHINAINVSSKIAKYGFVLKMMRLVHLLLFGLVVILPTVIASKKPNDEFAQFFKNTGPFLFTVLFALLEIYVRKNLFDVHEIQKSIRWSRKVIEFIRLLDRPESKPSTQIQIETPVTIPLADKKEEIEEVGEKKRERSLEVLKKEEIVKVGETYDQFLKRKAGETDRKNRERELKALEIEEAVEKEKQMLNIHHLVQLQEEVVEKEKKWIPCSAYTIRGSKDFAFRTSKDATSAFRENDFVIAYIRWTEAIRFDPTCSSYRSNRSQCLINLGYPALALADANAAIALACTKSSKATLDDLAFARYQEGVALHRLKKFERICGCNQCGHQTQT